MEELYPSVAEGVRNGRVPLVVRLPGRNDVALRISSNGAGVVLEGRGTYPDLQQAVDAVAQDCASSSSSAAAPVPTFDAWDVVFVCHPGLPSYRLRCHRMNAHEEKLGALLNKNWDRLPPETRALVEQLRRPSNLTQASFVQRGYALQAEEDTMRGPFAADVAVYEKLTAT